MIYLMLIYLPYTDIVAKMFAQELSPELSVNESCMVTQQCLLAIQLYTYTCVLYYCQAGLASYNHPLPLSIDTTPPWM